MKKRILAFLLAIVFVVGLLPVTALAESSQPEFKKVNMTLSGVLNVNFKVASNGANMDTYSVKVTIGEDVQNITDYTKEGELYVYSADLLAHKMHENMTVQLMNGDTLVGESKIFTVNDHVKALKELYAGDAELSAMLDAMVNYGTYAAYYAAPTGEAPNVSQVESVTAEDLAQYAFDIKTPGTAGLGAVAALYLHRACDLQIKFHADAFTGCKLLINGNEVTPEISDTKAVYAISELLPQDWGSDYNIKLLDSNGATVFETDYNVMSYANAALNRVNEVQTGLNGLLKAMYRYYVATAAYAGANDMHTSVVTPNSNRFLYKDGVNNGYRFIFDTANTDVKRAVDFINTQFNQLTGVKIDYPGTIDQVNWDMSKKYLVVGNHTMFAAAGLEMPAADLGATGYYIVTKGNSVFIMAQEGADEAQAYQLAALAFLKAVVGYEMYAQDCVSYTVADGKNFTIPDMKIINKPDVDYRNEGNYASVGGGSYGMGYTDTGIFIPINGNVYHTALDLLNPETYYGDHADWFFLEKQAASWWESITGTERYRHYQLCYGTILNDTQAQDIIYNNLKAAAVANPGVNNISFGPADNNYICNCATCSSVGAVSAYVQVANLMAARLAADPEVTQDVKLIVFAYRQYKNAPADVKAHENVGVMVAPIEASFNTPISQQSEFASNIQAWADISDHLYIWYYQANFDHYLYPMDSWDVMQSNIQFARENSADFIFYQNQGVTASHFSKLKDYLEAELTKNADADYNTLVNNFFTNYFGPAAAPMRQYFDALQAHMNASGSTGAYKEAINTTAFWPQAKLQEFMGYIGAAYAAVKDSGSAMAGTYNERIKLESLFPRFALLSLYSDTAAAGTANNFAVDCSALAVTNYNEMTAWADSDYSGWWNHTCSAWSEYAHDRCLVSGATEQSGAVYYKTCSACGAINPEETFVEGGSIVNESIDTEVIAENGTLVLENDGFVAGEAAVTVGEATKTGNVADGKLTVNVADLAYGQLDDVVVTQGKNSFTYINVLHVTQVIDDVAELKALGAACKAANTTGYYILGGDIDCSGEANMAAGNPGWQANGFSGIFDGRGYTISGIKMVYDDATNGYGGLFGNLMGATVKNVTFDGVNYASVNVSLFGRHNSKPAGGNNNIIENVTVNISAWNATGEAGVFASRGTNSTLYNNVVINVADNVAIHNLLGQEWNSNHGSGITVNLGLGSSIASYYYADTATAQTEPPSIMTVNSAREPIEETLNTLVAGEGTTAVTFQNSAFTDTVNVTINGQTKSVAASNGALSVNLADFGISEMGQYSAVIEADIDTYTYTEVWYVTQVIDDVAELKALGAACKAANTTGYYILGGDIDCSGEANMAAGNPGWQANGFSGTFNGRGHVVSNIKMTYDNATGGYGGLFGNLAGATILNTTFDKVNYASVNVALLGRHSYAKNGVNNTIENITINISGWGASGEAGLLVSRGTLNTLHNNIVVNVADGLTIHNLLGQEWKSNYGTGIVVNLTAESTISSYYYADTATVQTTPPSIMTVNAPIDVTLDTLVAAEGSTAAAFVNEDFTSGTATVTINDQTKSAAMADGVLNVDLADFGVSAMGQYNAVIQTAAGKYTYTDVWYVTQSIDTVAELKALGAACKAANTTGYYILGGDIDCSGEANMAAGNPGWEANGFSGTFNGRNKTISNIKLTWDNPTGGYGGLFGNLDGCLIENVVFDKVNYASANVALLGRHTYKTLGSDNTRLNNLTVNVSNWAASGEAGLLVSRSSRNTLFNGITVNVADGVTIHNLLGQGFNSAYGSGITVNLGVGSLITALYWTGTTADTGVTSASFIKVQ